MPSPELWQGIENALRSPPRVCTVRRRFLGAAAAILLLTAGAVTVWRLYDSGPPAKPSASLVTALWRDHEEFLAGEFGPAFPGPPPAHILESANGRVDAAAFAALPRVAAFKPEGSRLCHLAGVPVAWTLGHWQGQPVSWVALSRSELHHFPDVCAAIDSGAPFVSQSAGRFHFAARAVGPHVVCAFGEAPASQLEELLRTVPDS